MTLDQDDPRIAFGGEPDEHAPALLSILAASGPAHRAIVRPRDRRAMAVASLTGLAPETEDPAGCVASGMAALSRARGLVAMHAWACFPIRVYHLDRVAFERALDLALHVGLPFPKSRRYGYGLGALLCRVRRGVHARVRTRERMPRASRGEAIAAMRRTLASLVPDVYTVERNGRPWTVCPFAVPSSCRIDIEGMPDDPPSEDAIVEVHPPPVGGRTVVPLPRLGDVYGTIASNVRSAGAGEIDTFFAVRTWLYARLLANRPDIAGASAIFPGDWPGAFLREMWLPRLCVRYRADFVRSVLVPRMADRSVRPSVPFPFFILPVAIRHFRVRPEGPCASKSASAPCVPRVSPATRPPS